LAVGDGTLAVYDSNDGQRLLYETAQAAGAISPDGARIVSAGTSGVAEYDCALCGGLDQLLAAAKQFTTEPLTPTERAQYLNAG
jgi:hypothetical protein